MDKIEPKTKCCMTGNFDNTCKSEVTKFNFTMIMIILTSIR